MDQNSLEHIYKSALYTHETTLDKAALWNAIEKKKNRGAVWFKWILGSSFILLLVPVVFWLNNNRINTISSADTVDESKTELVKIVETKEIKKQIIAAVSDDNKVNTTDSAIAKTPIITTPILKTPKIKKQKTIITKSEEVTHNTLSTSSISSIQISEYTSNSSVINSSQKKTTGLEAFKIILEAPISSKSEKTAMDSEEVLGLTTASLQNKTVYLDYPEIEKPRIRGLNKKNPML